MRIRMVAMVLAIGWAATAHAGRCDTVCKPFLDGCKKDCAGSCQKPPCKECIQECERAARDCPEMCEVALTNANDRKALREGLVRLSEKSKAREELERAKSSK